MAHYADGYEFEVIGIVKANNRQTARDKVLNLEDIQHYRLEENLYLTPFNEIKSGESPTYRWIE